MLKGGVAPPLTFGSKGGKATLIVKLVVVELPYKPKPRTT
jgi:hypothetical protein